MNNIIRLAADLECIPKTLDFLNENLSNVKGISTAKKQLTMMRVEDYIGDILKVADRDKFITIEHHYLAGKSKIYLSYHGKKMESLVLGDGTRLIDVDDSENALKEIKCIVARAFANKCLYHYREGIGVVEILVKTSIYNFCLSLLTVFILVFISGLLIVLFC